jgi:hypothetical protein
MALLGANTNIHAPPQADEGFAWRSRADELDAAKRRASTSFARLSTQPDSKAQAAAWAQDEIAVLRARVDLLNTLMTNPDNARLCLDNDKPPRVCVMYNRMRCEGETELGPMQSTMAWAVRGAEKPVEHLMSTGELAQAGCVKDLLGLIKASMPRKDILQPLDTVLGLPPPERLVLKSVAGVNAQQAGHTRVIEGLGEAHGETLAPLYQVVWGALDVAAHEAWQNPSTNAAIRLSVLDTAHQVARDAARTKDAPWSSVAYLQVRICHGEECHVLSLTPFCDSESCTVTHLQYAQSVFDVHGPERGILNLAQDPASIHAIPGGKILPLQAYVCLGAHRKTRLSEAQLNYVHAQGLLAHGFDTRLLPPAQKLVFEANRMPAAKSTRVSATGLDVLASSYHIADQVYTTISVVQYPPFGTQFETKCTGIDAGAKGGFPTLPAFKSVAGAKSISATPYLGTSESDEEMDDGGEDMDDDDNIHRIDIPGPAFRREPLREGETPSFLIPHEYLPNLDAMGKPRARKNNWKIELRRGEHYFVDAICGDPTELKNRFIWFEIDDGDRYKRAQQAYHELKEYIRSQRIHWNKVESFYWNLYNNHNIGKDGQTAGAIWNHYWKQFIAQCAVQDMLAFRAGAHIQSFWYVADTSLWRQILPGQSIIHGVDDADYYANLQGAGMRKLKTMRDFPDNPIIRSRIRAPRQQVLGRNQLPIPQRQSVAANNKPDPASVARLQTRISALETRLARARQDENTQFLLERVLEKLDVVD